MKTDKAQLIEAIEAIKKKLALMEEELNKSDDQFKHFPSNGDEYHYYISTGTLCSNTAADDEVKVNAYRTEKEAQEAYNKAIALEKVKRRLLKLQGDWKPDFNDDCVKYVIYYSYENNRFKVS